MKRYGVFIFMMLFFSVVCSYSQGTLTFRFANPRIIRIAGYDNFEFEVQVRAGTAGTYLWSGQAILRFDNTTFTQLPTQWSLVRGPLLTGTNTADNYKYALVKTITGTAPSKVLNIGWTGDVNVVQNSPNPDDFNEVPVEFTTLLTVRGRILVTTGTAGIEFNKVAMNGQQFYCTATPPYYAMYTNPNDYQSGDFITTYVERLFSGMHGWSQTGNSTNAQWVNWTTAANTSIWDTAAIAAQIGTPGALAGQMRIHTKARLKIIPGASLTCSGNSEVFSPLGLWIVSDATGTGSFIDNGTISYGTSGSILAEKYTGFGKWYSFCLPVLSTTTAPFSQVNLTYFTEPDQHFRYVIDPAPPDSVLTGTPFRGYRIRSNTNPAIVRVNPSGSLVTGTVSSVPLTRTSPSSTVIYNGFNFSGNPYSSGLDLASPAITWTNLENKTWFLNPVNGGNYEVFIPAGGGTHANYAGPFEGFFIKHTESNTVPATFNLTAAARTHTHSSPVNNGSLADLLYLKAQSASGDIYDQLSVGFRETATSGYDVQFDAEKLWGDAGSPQFYSIITGRNLTVQSLPWTGGEQIIPLGFSTTIPGTYKILASNLNSFSAGTIITLEDLKLNVTQSLTANPQYQFTYVSGDAANRFRLHFTNPAYPAMQASNIQIISAVAPSMKFNWTDGNGAKRLVFMRQDTIGFPVPASATMYSASTVFGSGTQVGSSGWFCVFNGTTHSAGLTVTNLTLNTRYRIMVLEYNETGGNRYINTAAATGNPQNQMVCPTITPAITGSATGCLSATGYTYSTTAAMNTYQWQAINGTVTTGQGTNTVTIKWNIAGNDTVKVSYRTVDGCQSVVAFKKVTVTADPVAAGVITGSNNVCVGATNITYCVPVITNATSYTWTLSSGITPLSGATTRCITVAFSNTPGPQSLSVKGNNLCGSGASSTINVSINPKLTGKLTLKNVSVISGRDLCFSADTILTAGSGTTFVVQNGGKASLIAGSLIKLLAGTKTNPGGKMNASIATTCVPCANSKSEITSLLNEPEGEVNAIQAFNENDFVSVFPNPTSGTFTVLLKYAEGSCSKANILVRSLLGTEVMKTDIRNSYKTLLSLANNPAGIYLITISCGDHTKTIKLVKQ